MTTNNDVIDLSRMIIRGGYLDDEINARNPVVLQFVDAVGDDRVKPSAPGKTPYNPIPLTISGLATCYGGHLDNTGTCRKP